MVSYYQPGVGFPCDRCGGQTHVLHGEHYVRCDHCGARPALTTEAEIATLAAWRTNRLSLRRTLAAERRSLRDALDRARDTATDPPAQVEGRLVELDRRIKGIDDQREAIDQRIRWCEVRNDP